MKAMQNLSGQSNMKHILKCIHCGIYTMKETHCNDKTIRVIPPKYSPEDKYGDYRRKVKRPQLEEKGLL